MSELQKHSQIHLSKNRGISLDDTHLYSIGTISLYMYICIERYTNKCFTTIMCEDAPALMKWLKTGGVNVWEQKTHHSSMSNTVLSVIPILIMLGLHA